MSLFLKKLGLLILVLFLSVISFCCYISEPLPKGVKGVEAEELTDKVQMAINQKAWDSTVAISFDFRSSHYYLWDKKRDFVQVSWGDTRVIFNTQTGAGFAYVSGKEVGLSKSQDLIKTGVAYFNNDSFWLIAPFKLRDPGTVRSVVDIDGQKCLMITYLSGGSTPGDSYVWLLDGNNVPKAWKLWVGIIPVGGVTVSWERWKIFPNGLRLSTFRDGLFSLTFNNVVAAKTAGALNGGVDPFSRLKF